MRYKIRFSKNSTDIVDFSNTVLLKAYRKHHFFKRKYKVYDNNDNLLLVFQKTDFLLFFTKTKILFNNLGEQFQYKDSGLTFSLIMNCTTITFQGQVIGLLSSEFKSNGEVLGNIKEIYAPFNNSMIFTFPEDKEINKYCLILFIIATVNYWDPH